MRVEWTITPAQFKQWRQRAVLLRFVLLPLGLAACLFLALLPRILSSTRTQPEPPLGIPFWLAALALGLYCCVAFVPLLWQSHLLLFRRHTLLLASKGNFCPRCNKPVTRTPCRHGLSEEHSALLCEYWEGTILGWKGRASAAFQAVSHMIAQSPDAFWTVRLQDRARATLLDAKAAWIRRFAAASVGLALPMMLWMWVFTQVAGIGFMTETNFLPITVGTAIMMAAMMASMAPAIAAARSAPLRCARCGHELPPQRSRATCTECGAGLSAPGSVVQPFQSISWKPIMVIALLTTPLFAWPIISGMGLHYRWMSPAALVAKVQGAAPREQWLLTQHLEGRTLSPTELHALCDALVANSGRHDSSNFVHTSVPGKALLSGALASSDAENLIRATTQVQLEPPAALAMGQPLTLAVTAWFGPNHFQLTHMRCIQISSVTMDGVAQPLEPWMVTEGNASQTSTFTLPAITTHGRHTITLHAWSVVVPFAQFKHTFPLDSRGVPVLPPGSACVELAADATIIVPQAEPSRPAQPAQPAQPGHPPPAP